MSVSRRDFVAGLASAAIVGCARKTDRPLEGGFLDRAGARGHALRDGSPAGAPAGASERVAIVIVGGGVAGLSAAWWLQRNGFTDFVVLEMEDDPGGNARWGRNEVSAYPLGAHYVPVPETGASLVSALFEDLGVLRDGVWDETMLVHSPQVRLFRWGRWLGGLTEALMETAAERREFERFFDEIAEHRESGRFTIPAAVGMPTASPLDALSMEDWMDERGFRSPALRWYVDYACRDDYGTRARDVSAWAGIHYHAARPPEGRGPLTWPEGNGWVVRRLAERLGSRIRSGEPALRVEADRSGATVRTARATYRCGSVVWAAPAFVAPFVVEGAPVPDVDYAPWVTAQLTLDRQPSARGAEIAWDNVLFDSAALGYVVADHQVLRTHRERSVWTWYSARSDATPRVARQRLLDRPWRSWVDEIFADLGPAHADLRECVSRVDVFRIGHGMPRPAPGFLSGRWRARLRGSDGPVFYGGSDVSGLSLFEEAQHNGVEAARRAMSRVGGTP